jgi:hypothetical protein
MLAGRSMIKPKAGGSICAVLLGTLLLSACGASTGGRQIQSVSAVEATLATAEVLAAAYIELPSCTGQNAPVCSTPAIVVQIKAADATAYAATLAASQAASDPQSLDAADSAVNVLAAIVKTLPQRGK